MNDEIHTISWLIVSDVGRWRDLDVLVKKDSGSEEILEKSGRWMVVEKIKAKTVSVIFVPDCGIR